MNNEPAALLEGDRHSSFHLWGKSREYEHGRSHEGRNGDGRERFDHLIPDSKDDCTEGSIVPVLVLLLPLALSTTALCSGRCARRRQQKTPRISPRTCACVLSSGRCRCPRSRRERRCRYRRVLHSRGARCSALEEPGSRTTRG